MNSFHIISLQLFLSLGINNIRVEISSLPMIGPPKTIFPDGSTMPDFSVILDVNVVLKVTNYFHQMLPVGIGLGELENEISGMETLLPPTVAMPTHVTMTECVGVLFNEKPDDVDVAPRRGCTP